MEMKASSSSMGFSEASVEAITNSFVGSGGFTWNMSNDVFPPPPPPPSCRPPTPNCRPPTPLLRSAPSLSLAHGEHHEGHEGHHAHVAVHEFLAHSRAGPHLSVHASLLLSPLCICVQRKKTHTYRQTHHAHKHTHTHTH